MLKVRRVLKYTIGQIQQGNSALITLLNLKVRYIFSLIYLISL